MAKPKFYLEPRTLKASEQPAKVIEQAINMFYSFNGVRLQYYTGIRVDVKNFRPECNTKDTISPVKGTAPFSAAYNIKLKGMAAKVVSIVSDAKGADLTLAYVRQQLDAIYKPKPAKLQVIDLDQKKPDTLIGWFDKTIQDSEAGKRLLTGGKNAGHRYSFNAIKNYRTSLAAVKRYLDYQGTDDLALASINKRFYDSFKDYCFSVEKKEISTFSNYVKDLKTVMKESRFPGFDPTEYKKPSYEADTVYLTLGEIEQIVRLDLSDRARFLTLPEKPNQKPVKVYYPTLDTVRDLFLIGCFTGLRFSDFNKLDIKSIDKNFVKLKQTKTNGRVVIPIMSKLRPVFAKYPDRLPVISNQKFNEYIKLLAALAGLTQEREIRSTKGNVLSEKKMPLNTLISSHCCRRSYATNMFNAKVPTMLIMSATGHKSESSFLRYIRATSQDKAELMADILQKLGL